MSKTCKGKETDNRRNTISIRLSDEELGRLRFICGRLNITQSEYIRQAILTATVKRPTLVTALDDESTRTLLAHFGKVGSNLNQIARVLNQGYLADSGIITEIRHCIQKLNQGVSVLQAVGGQG